MKKILTILSLLLTSFIHTTQITFTNNSQFTIFISDHLTFGAILEPEQSHTLSSSNPITFYVYLESNAQEQTFSLTYRVQETTQKDQSISINYYDITSRQLDKLHPNQFTITHQTRLAFEQRHDTNKQPVPQPQQLPQQKNNEVKNKLKPYSGATVYKSHPTSSHESTLNTIIDQYNKMKQQQGNGQDLASELVKITAMAQRRHTPYKPPVQTSSAKKDKEEK